nr:MAG: DNA pilot protein [Microvirus sp.]
MITKYLYLLFPKVYSIGPLAAGLAIAGGSLVGGMMGNRASAKEASRNRHFQEEMSDTAHQREVKDLRLAGLNPILSAGGKGASTPGGSMAAQKDPLTPGISSAISAYQSKATLDNTQANTQNTAANTMKTLSDTTLAGKVEQEFDAAKRLYDRAAPFVKNSAKAYKAGRPKKDGKIRFGPKSTRNFDWKEHHEETKVNKSRKSRNKR